jgi:hypothetical protein
LNLSASTLQFLTNPILNLAGEKMGPIPKYVTQSMFFLLALKTSYRALYRYVYHASRMADSNYISILNVREGQVT